MKGIWIKEFKTALAVFIAVLALGACATPPDEQMAGEEKEMMKEEMMAETSATEAAALRVALNALLQEHVYLAAAATGAALDGRSAEFQAAANAVDGNSIDLAAANGSVYGPDAEAAFLPLWRKHIGFIVNYTTGVATGDVAMQEQAVNDLVAYTTEFGAFVNSASPALPADAVASLVKEHVLTFKAVIDAQAADKPGVAYPALREAAAHMQMIANAHSGAIAQQFPEKFNGTVTDTPASSLRTALNLLVREHVYLAAEATNAALDGRSADFQAAAEALDANSVALAKANGSVYGPDAEAAFLPLWRKHIGFVVDYTTGVATNDAAKQEKAVNDLLAYTTEFGAFLNSASPSLPADAVAGLVKEHVITLKSVIDAQAAEDHAAAYTSLRKAVAHMQNIADAHAEAIVQQFPAMFAKK